MLHVDGHDDCLRASYKRRSDGSASVEFIRSFDTCHQEDYLIEDGTVHVVYASGSGPLYRFVIYLLTLTSINPLICACRIDGVAPSKDDVGFQRTRLLKPPAAVRKHPKPDDIRPLLIANVQLNVPAQETTYWCRVVRLPQHFNRKLHVLQVYQ